MTIIAIHQPNFFPWLGYFDKIVRADIFILLDHVQFPKTGGTWINRVQLLVNGTPTWITMPIIRAYHGTRSINEMLINEELPWRDKLLKTLKANYSRANYFRETFPFIETLIMRQTSSVSEFNIKNINVLIETFGLQAKRVVCSSSLGANGYSTEMLIGLVNAVDGDAYLYGSGAIDYQENEKFHQKGIRLLPQNFQPPVYSQIKSREFVPGLSVIDVLMNCGIGGTKDILSIN